MGWRSPETNSWWRNDGRGIRRRVRQIGIPSAVRRRRCLEVWRRKSWRRVLRQLQRWRHRRRSPEAPGQAAHPAVTERHIVGNATLDIVVPDTEEAVDEVGAMTDALIVIMVLITPVSVAIALPLVGAFFLMRGLVRRRRKDKKEPQTD